MVSLRTTAMVTMVMLIAACGFQLRGEARLPAVMSQTWVQVDDDSTAFMRELGLRLEANGVELVDRPSEQAAVLQIHAERMNRQALSISGQARVREFLLIFEVDFELRDGQGNELMGRERLRLTRDYSFDEQEILAAQREEEFLRADLRRAMTARLLRRLEALEEV